MTERDWDAELRKIDQQMEKAAAASAAAPRPPVAGSAPGAVQAPPAGAGAPERATTGFGVYARLSLAVALGVGMIFWPYAARCGPGLGLYLGAVGALLVSGIWSGVWSFRHRAARAHVLSLLLVLWGLVLAGIEVLPRVGYAIPTVDHPAAWTCGG
jgi:hypothetical protein